MTLLPNLIIPGAPKSATTSLTEYLKQHKDVYVPELKEPRFFISRVIEGLPNSDPLKAHLMATSALTENSYYELYKNGMQAKYRCDASVHYMYYHDLVIPELKKKLIDPSIIIVLRDPVERIFSNYKYLQKERQDNFDKSLQLEEERLKNGWNSFWLLIRQGLYYQQVKHFMDEFPKVKVILLEEFNRDTNKIMFDVFNFLEIDPIKVDTKTIHNRSGVPANKFYDWLIFKENFLKKIPRIVLKKIYSDDQRQRMVRMIRDKFVVQNSIEINADVHNKLVDAFSDDVLQLQELLKKDLTKWLKKK